MKKIFITSALVIFLSCNSRLSTTEIAQEIEYDVWYQIVEYLLEGEDDFSIQESMDLLEEEVSYDLTIVQKEGNFYEGLFVLSYDDRGRPIDCTVKLDITYDGENVLWEWQYSDVDACP
tara:strand:- start:1827 stop:2183 length:357 start_codon:yes stop_codon:yes gene_type:complete